MDTFHVGDIAGDLECDMPNPFSKRESVRDYEKGVPQKKRDSAENISGILFFGGENVRRMPHGMSFLAHSPLLMGFCAGFCRALCAHNPSHIP